MRNTPFLARFRGAMIALAVLGSALFANAAPADDADPPGRVARVNLLDGHGAVEPAGSDQWVEDLVNRPLTGGDKLWIDAGARAEMHIGSSAVRLGARTALQIVAVDDRSVRLRVTAGSINVRIRTLDDDRFEIETPAGEIELLQPGGYRLDVDDQDSRAQLTVWSGRAEVQGVAGSRDVHTNESVEMTGGDQSDLAMANAGSPDSLDLWAEDRDHREDQSRTAQYVSRDVVGYEELDGYGDWSVDPVYGSVWYPQLVVTDWAPYRYGHWVWINVWGWTWIDDAPWGFAPCHYGRWVHSGRGWGWAPGPRNWHRPVFAPALVAWRGDRYPRRGPGGAPGAGAGGAPLVGWVPLGYNEMYEPPFHASHAYLRAANLSNTRLGHVDVDRYIDGRARGGNQAPPRTYANERVPGAYTAMSSDAFVAARSVARNRVTTAPDNSQPAGFSAAGPDLRPQPRSIGRSLPSDRPGIRPDRAVFDRPVVSAPASSVSGTRAPPPTPMIERRADAPTVLSTSPRSQAIDRQPQVIERAPTRSATQPQPEYRAPQPQYHAPQPQPQPEYHAPPPQPQVQPPPQYRAPPPQVQPPPQYRAPQPEYHAPPRESRSEPPPPPAPRADVPRPSQRPTDRNER